MGARFSLLLLIDVAGITSKREGFVMIAQSSMALGMSGRFGHHAGAKHRIRDDRFQSNL